jgi:chaperonin GroES
MVSRSSARRRENSSGGSHESADGRAGTLIIGVPDSLDFVSPPSKMTRRLALSTWECQIVLEVPRISVEVIPMKLKPLGDRLIVKAVEEDTTTASGIVLPDTAKEKPQKGKVLAVGDGKLDDNGQRVPLDVSEGDEVLYSKYGGTEISVEGEDLLVLRESDVLAKVQS